MNFKVSQVYGGVKFSWLLSLVLRGWIFRTNFQNLTLFPGPSIFFSIFYMPVFYSHVWCKIYWFVCPQGTKIPFKYIIDAYFSDLISLAFGHNRGPEDLYSVFNIDLLFSTLIPDINEQNKLQIYERKPFNCNNLVKSYPHPNLCEWMFYHNSNLIWTLISAGGMWPILRQWCNMGG